MKDFLEKIFTWGNDTFFPKWCDEDGHWTFKFLDLMWVDCPCCLLLRGVVVGLVAGVGLGATLGAGAALLLM